DGVASCRKNVRFGTATSAPSRGGKNLSMPGESVLNMLPQSTGTKLPHGRRERTIPCANDSPRGFVHVPGHRRERDTSLTASLSCSLQHETRALNVDPHGLRTCGTVQHGGAVHDDVGTRCCWRHCGGILNVTDIAL